ncbi:hypothetical protein A3K69_07240 [Candidatus Bathyarchaeota archaeon RBG_16_57_9]|nr:MAG: hypothetical protein A3K69_07240 [Candidatus Bathyarchaeota archaeon RBG_16_57_9]
MVEVFTDEDRRNINALAEEMPKLRILLEELIETFDVLGDGETMRSIRASEKDLQEGGLLDFSDALKELGPR